MNASLVHDVIAQTDTGLVRSHNEDSLVISLQDRLVIVADGMGGYQAGEVASKMAADIITAEIGSRLALRASDMGQGLDKGLLRSAIEVANLAVYQSAQSQAAHAGMGTTVVVGLFDQQRLTVAHLGDSRLYRLRALQLKRITRDHSLLQEQIDSGLISAHEAMRAPNKNLVTRALGIDPTVDPEISDYQTEEGDLYLFCTDGLTDMVPDQDIEMTLQALESNLRLCAQHLIANANDNGGRDNITVVLVRINRNRSIA